MKKQFLLTCCWLLTVSCLAQSINWQWGKAAGNQTPSEGEEGWGVAAGAIGDVYICGYFDDNMFLGHDTLLTGGYELFSFVLARYDASGNAKWARCEAYSNEVQSEAAACAADHRDNVYVTGRYLGGPMIVDADTLPCDSSHYPIFLIKYDSTGNLLWALGFDQPYRANELTGGLAIDADDNVYLTGYYDDTIIFGGQALTGSSYGNYFLAKFDSGGNTLWARNSTGALQSEGNAVCTDGAGNVFVTGPLFGDSVVFGDDTVFTGGSTETEVFTAGYSSTGDLLWLRTSIGPNNRGISNAIAIDASDNVYITGSFYGDSLSFGNIVLYNSVATAPSNTTTLFIAKYDAKGNLAWAKNSESDGNVNGYTLAVDRSNTVYVAGGFDGDFVFDSLSFQRPQSSYDPSFLLGLDTNGNLLCSTTLVSGGDDQNALSADNFGNVYFGGDYYGPVVLIFGTDTFMHQDSLTENIFVAKFNCGAPVAGIGVVSPESSISIFPNPSTGAWQLGVGNELLGAAIEVYDNTGQLIAQSKIISLKTEINLPVSEGVYLLRISTQDGVILRKLVRF